MKLIIIGAVFAFIIAAVSFFCGWLISKKTQEVPNFWCQQLSTDHCMLASKLDSVETKLESMDSKLQLLVNIATRPSPYENDVAK